MLSVGSQQQTNQPIKCCYKHGDIYTLKTILLSISMCVYVCSTALDSARPGPVCLHLSADGGTAAFLSMTGLYRGETIQTPEMLHSCYKGVT